MEANQPKVTGFELLCPTGHDGSTWVDDFICLNVVTIEDAAKMWKKHPHTLRSAFKNRKLTGIDFSGKLMILTVPSLVRLYGDPVVSDVKIHYPAGVINPHVSTNR